ncbi:hypothetical protein LZ30DRAFT_611108 [Colletotrichum cereale]|nr:hypothetical protein LZ30DRAFT_611108 [Colletotrichum cereale]
MEGRHKVESQPLIGSVPDLPNVEKFLSDQPQASNNRWWCILLGAIIGNATGLLFTILFYANTVELRASSVTLPEFRVASEINGLVPAFPLQKTTFSNLTVRWPLTESWIRGEVSESEWDQLLHSLHSLIPHGGGFVEVKDPRRFLLPPPLIISWPEKPTVYSISVFHQLHCFTSILRDFNRIRNCQSPAQPMRHLLHCFDFIRQAILCCGDCTTEDHLADGLGNYLKDEMRTQRVCNNFVKLLEYGNTHAPKRADSPHHTY